MDIAMRISVVVKITSNLCSICINSTLMTNQTK